VCAYEAAAVQWLSVSLVIARYQVQCPVGVVFEQGTVLTLLQSAQLYDGYLAIAGEVIAIS